MNAKVLIVEDEEALALLLQYNLEAEGFRVSLAQRGDEAEVAISEDPPDLIILDWMLPGLSGIELCRRLRARKTARPIPILILTARGEEQDRIRGLTVGADDYVVKPFSVLELLARVRSLLRRTPARRDKLRIDDLEIDTRHQRAERGGVPLNLTPKEFLLLTHLAHSSGQVVSRDEIAEHVWDIGFKTDTNVVDVVVRRLRAKVDDPFKTKLVHTIRGMGYVLKAP